MNTSSPAETPPKPNRPDHGDLDRLLVRGLAWTSVSKWGTQLVAWASTLIVARILTPTDYGIVSIATVYLGILTVISEFGIGTAVITLRELSREQIAQLNGFAILLGLTGLAITVAVAHPLGRFFYSPQLPTVLEVMGMGFILNSFQSVPAALLQREMRFRTLSLIDGTRGLVLSAATVMFALMGLHYWTLVLGALLSSVIGTTLLLWNRPHGFSWPRFGSLGKAMQFSSHILVSRICWYGYSNSDFLVAGRMLGQAALGAYTMAWTLANVPIEKIASLVGNVTPALFSKVQAERPLLRRYFCHLTEVIALITFPLSFGMALVAHDFILLMLGPKWQGSILPLRLLCIYATVRCIVPILAHVVNVTGDTRFGMRLSLLNVIVLSPAFYFFSRWGSVGIAAAWMIVSPFLNIPLYRRVLLRLDLSLAGYLICLRPALNGSLIMSAGVLLLKYLLPASWPLASRFSISVMVGAFLYISAVVVLHGQRVQGILRQVRRARVPAVERASVD